jgi:hypothetical protein
VKRFWRRQIVSSMHGGNIFAALFMQNPPAGQGEIPVLKTHGIFCY